MANQQRKPWASFGSRDGLFVLGYFVSGMIQAFVPKEELTKYMGEANFKSISLSTFFGAASSSCSFAALAAV